MNKKNGGPYTKEEQEERRNKVHELHFEKSMSSRKIAELLGKSRNTINEDIKYFNEQLSKEISEVDYLASFMTQVNRLELSRCRLIEELEKQEKIGYKLAIEKQILTIDDKLSVLYEKIPRLQHFQNIPKISEEQIRTFTRNLVLTDPQLEYDIEEMPQKIIEFHKCDLLFAREFDTAMHKLGLGACGDNLSYDMIQFANIRFFLTDAEKKKVDQKLEKLSGKSIDKFIKDISD